MQCKKTQTNKKEKQKQKQKSKQTNKRNTHNPMAIPDIEIICKPKKTKNFLTINKTLLGYILILADFVTHLKICMIPHCYIDISRFGLNFTQVINSIDGVKAVTLRTFQ